MSAHSSTSNLPSKRQKTVSSPRFVEKKIALSDIRDSLIRQEETIIFAVIERAQFKLNPKIYLEGKDSILNAPSNSAVQRLELGFVRYFLFETESTHAKIGRFEVSDEHSFFPRSELPGSVLARTWEPTPIKPNAINLNDEIFASYRDAIVPSLCASGDDGHYGSASLCDINVLQNLSYRIHYGKFVAEAKFQANVDEFSRLIRAKDADGLMKLLTHPVTEKKVVERVLKKAQRYARERDDEAGAPSPLYKIDPQVVAEMYENYLIPLNKKVQVAYLLARLDE